MIVEMLQPLGGHHVGDRITVDEENSHGYVEVPADVVSEYVNAGYIKVVES